jgi:phage/plasmid-associated DNA primase
MRLIPFTQRFDGKKADPKLPDKLREELSGVLAWAVMGCVEWYQHGLGTAAVVEAATAAYRTETDVFERFMSEVCVFGRGKTVTKTELYEAYEQWCTEEGEEPKTIKTFGSNMKEKGGVRNFGEKKTNGIRIWTGIGLRESDPDPTLPTQSDPVQNSCKNGGRADRQGQILSDSAKVVGDGSREEGFSENGHNPTLPTLNAPEIITGPLSWEVDGMEIEYMPEGE